MRRSEPVELLFNDGYSFVALEFVVACSLILVISPFGSSISVAADGYQTPNVTALFVSLPRNHTGSLCTLGIPSIRRYFVTRSDHKVSAHQSGMVGTMKRSPYLCCVFLPSVYDTNFSFKSIATDLAHELTFVCSLVTSDGGCPERCQQWYTKPQKWSLLLSAVS